MSISVENLTREIVKNLEGYTEKVREGLDREKERVAKQAIKKLRTTGPKRTGKYQKGWKEEEKKFSGQNSVGIIHNEKHYRLTHLLEDGHEARNYEKNGIKVAAKPHIKNIEEAVVAEFIEAAERVIRNGG